MAAARRFLPNYNSQAPGYAKRIGFLSAIGKRLNFRGSPIICEKIIDAHVAVVDSASKLVSLIEFQPG